MPNIPNKPATRNQPWINGVTKLNQTNLGNGVNSNVTTLKGAIDGLIDALGGAGADPIGRMYGKYVSDNSLRVLPYDKVAIISVSANATFTLASAPEGCYPEYHAFITNSHGTNGVTLTFTEVSNILCNDLNCVVNANTISIPPSVTVECSIMHGECVAVNFAA